MVSKNNDITSFKSGGDKAILQEKGRGGRPAKPVAEKRNYKVVLSLTPAEGKTLREKAGLVKDATYLYAALKEAGVFD